MAPMAEQHHHRSTTKVYHKPFKSKHATKGAIKDLAKGRLEKDRWKKSYKSPQQSVMSKIDRRHHARQVRLLKHKEHEKATSVFAGQNGAPRIVAIIPLTEDVDANYTVEKLNQAVDIDAEVYLEQPHNVKIDRFKQSVQFVPLKRDLLTVLDACKIADYIVFILSSMEEVDEAGEQLLRAIESQGVSSVLTVVQGLDAIEPAKKRPQVLGSLKSFITHFFPSLDKVHSLDSKQDGANVMRSLCTSTPKGVRWREDRSWMLVDEVRWIEREDSKFGEAVLTGIVRGKGLKANRLLQVGDWGCFQAEKIVHAPLPNRKRKVSEMVVDEEIGEVLEQPDEDQDDTAELAPEEIVMRDDDNLAASEGPIERKGVLLDDHHYYSDESSHLPDVPKKVPKGTSSYQAAWYIGDESDSGSDWEDEPQREDVEMSGPALPQDGIEGLDQAAIDPTEAGPSEYPQSEMFLDPSPNDEAEQIAAYRKSRKKEAEEDLEFPDEIELHPNVLARERLARYRGLKSLRTSHWDTEEDKPYEPQNWNRLLQISDYRSAKGAATREALVGGVKPGTRVHIHLRNVPLSLKSSYSPSKPLPAFSLLRHEQKRTVVNYTITLNSEHPTPLKSKDELILQCGPRRFLINPLFSAPGSTPNDVHKFDRFLHPGRTAIATFIAPLTWGAVPALFFQRQSPSPSPSPDSSQPQSSTLSLIATGTAAPPSSTRVIAKRIILTGHPYKIHRKLVTVRYMFFNAEDVAWFKALQLWTRRGRSGFIKESLGTHGYFKAMFDAKINPQDAVGVSLWKRVWPREGRVLGVRERGEIEGMGDGVEEEEGMEGVEGGE